MFKYKSFWRLYAQSVVLSIPQIVTGYVCMQYLDFPLLDYEWSYIGLACSWLFSPLMVQVTRFKLMGINMMLLAVGFIGLSTEDYSSQLIYKIFTCIIGIIVGCDWLLTIRFIREQVGWEEERSVYLNNNPTICFFLGTLLRVSYIRNQNLEDEQIVISSLIALVLYNLWQTDSGVLLQKVQRTSRKSDNQESIFRQYSCIIEILIIVILFIDLIKEIEYFYISNNETYSQLNRRTSALFSKQYRQRFLGCSILALLSWFQFNNHNYFPKPQEIFQHPLRYFIPAILTIAVLSQILYRKFIVRNVMIFFNLMLLTFSILQLMKSRVKLFKDEEIFINFSMLLSYITYFIGLNLLITQQLPYKGITYTLNLTFVSLCGAQQVSHLTMEQIKSNEDCWLRYFQIMANILCFPVLLKLKNVKLLRECEIQQVYD